jgi:dethiobiotin synthetase
MQQTKGYFVAGTDTGVGKTLVACALVAALAMSGKRSGKSWRVAGMKPVAAGCHWQDGAWHNEDVDALLAVSVDGLARELVSPYLLREATAPHLAAARENIVLDIGHIERCFALLCQQADQVVVEGAGGFMVPLDRQQGMDDLACRLGQPVILVVGIRLGCISHALLTVQAIRLSGLPLAGWVANLIDEEMPNRQATIDTLQQRIAAPMLACLPRYTDSITAVRDAAALLELALLAAPSR